MHTSLNQRFSRAGMFIDSERKVSRKPNSLDCSITITNDAYGPPPSAIRAKLQAEKRNAALASKTRPIQSAPHNNHLNSGKRHPGDFTSYPGGPSNRGRVHPSNDWSSRSNGDDLSGRGRGRSGQVNAVNHSRGGIFQENLAPKSPDAFRGRPHNLMSNNFPPSSDSHGGGRFGFSSGGGLCANGRLAPTRRSIPARRGTAGRQSGSRHAHGTVGSARFDYGQSPSSQANMKYPRQNYHATAYGEMSWATNRYSKPHRGGRGDWFGRPTKSRGPGPMTNGHSASWMHDDRFDARPYKTAAGNRFGKRSLSDRKFDPRAFVNTSATDEYIDDFDPEELAKYKLDINLESDQLNFTVRSPLSSDPILRTPLSKWDSNELRYSPERDLFALHTPLLFDSDDGDDLGWMTHLSALNQKPKRSTNGQPTGGLNLTQGPHRRTGSQRGGRALVNGNGMHARHPGTAERSGNVRRNAAPQPKAGQKTLSSEHTSESTEQTSSSLITSSTHPSTGVAGDSGLGESIKPLSSTKSCQDLTSEGSLNLSLRALHLYRGRSWPEAIAGPSGPGAIDQGEYEEDEQAGESELLDRSPIARTRSCCCLPDEASDQLSYAPIRRTQSNPNWPSSAMGEEEVEEQEGVEELASPTQITNSEQPVG